MPNHPLGEETSSGTPSNPPLTPFHGIISHTGWSPHSPSFPGVLALSLAGLQANPVSLHSLMSLFTVFFHVFPFPLPKGVQESWSHCFPQGYGTLVQHSGEFSADLHGFRLSWDVQGLVHPISGWCRAGGCGRLGWRMGPGRAGGGTAGSPQTGDCTPVPGLQLPHPCERPGAERGHQRVTLGAGLDSELFVRVVWGGREL